MNWDRLIGSEQEAQSWQVSQPLSSKEIKIRNHRESRVVLIRIVNTARICGNAGSASIARAASQKVIPVGGFPRVIEGSDHERNCPRKCPSAVWKIESWID